MEEHCAWTTKIAGRLIAPAYVRLREEPNKLLGVQCREYVRGGGRSISNEMGPGRTKPVLKTARSGGLRQVHEFELVKIGIQSYACSTVPDTRPWLPTLA